MISLWSPHEKKGESNTMVTPGSFSSFSRQEMWYQVVHKPAVMIREQPDEKAICSGGCTLVYLVLDLGVAMEIMEWTNQ